MKKFLALLLALCLTMGLMAGCGNTETSSAAPASNPEETAAATPDEAPVEPENPGSQAEPAGSAEDNAPVSEGPTELANEIFGADAAPAEVSYPLDTTETLELLATFPDPLFASYPNAMADCQIYQEAEKATGIKVEYQGLSTSASAEQFNIMITSGDYPDLIGWGLNYANGDEAAVEEEIYLDLKEYIAEYAPNYYKLLSTDDELLKSVLTDSNYITGFNALRVENTQSVAGMVIRTDLLDKVGKDKPYTIDEYEDVLAAFKDEGLKQPLVMLSTGAIQGNLLGGAFNVNAYCGSFPMSAPPTYVEDGEIKFSPLEEGFKEYITLMHEWYEKAYIDPDFISINANWNSPDYSNAIVTGEAGIFFTDWGNIGGMVEASEIDGFALEATYDMHADKDSVNHFQQRKTKSGGNGFHITSNCDNIELACQWGDWWYTDEGSLLANYGVEGVSFEYGDDGKPAFTETVTDAPEGMRDALLIYASNDTICCVVDNNALASGYSELDKAAPDIWDEGVDDAYVIPTAVSLTAEENTEAAGIYSDIETLCMESIAAFITGDKSLDDYDAFVENIKSMNIEGYLEIQQAAYDRYAAK